MGYLADGHRELCVRSEWLQGTVDFGPTVAGQAAYPYPDNVDHILRVAVAGVPYSPAAEDVVQWISDGQLIAEVPTGGGLYYETTDDAGVQSLGLYPVPASDGVTIGVKSVLTPPDLSDSQDPVTPQRFDRYIEAYAKGNAFESLEDNPEDAAVYWQRFDQGVADLTALRVGRMGREPWTARVVGVNA